MTNNIKSPFPLGTDFLIFILFIELFYPVFFDIFKSIVTGLF